MKTCYALLGLRSLLTLAAGLSASAALPPRAEWTASASGGQDGEFPAAAAIDSRMDTRWSSPFEDGHFLAVDLGRPTPISGVRIWWETAYASLYRVETSKDGLQWDLARHVDFGDGQRDLLYFPTVTARYLRVVAERRATGWGASIWELDPLGPNETPRVLGAPPFAAGDIGKYWIPSDSNAVLELEWPEPEPISGLRIDWTRSARRTLRWQFEDEAGVWHAGDALHDSVGAADVLMHELKRIRRARLELRAAEPEALRILALTPRGPGEERTLFALYARAAAHAPAGWYPEALRGRQVYWTVVGLPASSHEALLDEYGNVEVFARGPTLMPYLRIGGRLITALDAANISQALAEGCLPLPSVEWDLSDVRLRIEAIPSQQDGRDVTLVRYTVSARGEQPVDGELLLLLRPLQINPPWQHGGASPIYRVAHREGEDASRVSVDAWGYTIHPPAAALTAVSIAAGDVVDTVARDRWPQLGAVWDPAGALSCASRHPFHLAPGESETVVLTASASGDPPALVRAETFEALREELARIWRNQIRRVRVSLCDREVEDTLYAQVGYILVNRDGVALQPGSRNYDRVWIRDGALTASALLRMGLAAEAMDYFDWYARAVRDDGLVPPILNPDGSVYAGFGSNLEYDAQGQFVYLLAEIVRFTDDEAFLRRHYPTALRALRFVQALRERTMTDDYAADDPRRARYRGLVPASISHEGYSTPHHSYWDNYWALRGWRDGAALAHRMGDTASVEWARAQYDALADSVRASLARTMAECGIDFIPGSAERGDPDATSVSIAIFPCDVARDLFDADALARTYDDYLAHVAARDTRATAWLYTPYEARNIAALQMMGRLADARALHARLFRDRRPTGWRHFAEVVASDPRQGVYIGDMPHTWVGADYLHSVRTMLVREDGDTLHLLEGAPIEWWSTCRFELEGMPTYWGPVHLQIHPDGKCCAVALKTPPRLTGRVRVYVPHEMSVTHAEINGMAHAMPARESSSFYEWTVDQAHEPRHANPE